MYAINCFYCFCYLHNCLWLDDLFILLSSILFFPQLTIWGCKMYFITWKSFSRLVVSFDPCSVCRIKLQASNSALQALPTIHLNKVARFPVIQFNNVTINTTLFARFPWQCDGIVCDGAEIRDNVRSSWCCKEFITNKVSLYNKCFIYTRLYIQQSWWGRVC